MKQPTIQIIALCVFLLSVTSASLSQRKPAAKNSQVEPPKAVKVPKTKPVKAAQSAEQEDIYRINPTPDETAPFKVYVPKDLEDSFVELKKMLHPTFVEKFKNNDAEVINQHFGLGMWMRNNWGLWAGLRLAKYFNGIGIFHPDDMSGIILSNFRLHLNGKPLEVEAQVAYYKEYSRVSVQPKDEELIFPGCPKPMSWKGSVGGEVTGKMPRKIHVGRCPADNKIWLFERDKGWYEPSEEIKSKIERGEFSQVWIIKGGKDKGKINKRKRK